MWRRVGRAGVIAAGLAVTVFVTLGLADAAMTGERIHPGVVAGDISLSGLTKSQASARLKEELRPVLGKPAALTYGHRRWRLRPSDFDLAVDFDGTAERAWLCGRESNPISNSWQRLLLWVRQEEVDVSASLNRDAGDSFLAAVSSVVATDAVDAALAVSGTDVVRTRARRGLAVRPAAALRTMVAAMLSRRSRLARLPVRVVTPGIDDDGVVQALGDAKLMLRRPLHLAYGRSAWRIGRPELARWILFERQLLSSTPHEPRVVLRAALDKRAVARRIRRITKKATRPAVDATFRVEGERVRVVPSQMGRGVDTNHAYRNIGVALRRRGHRRVTLVMGPLRPRLTTEWARSTGITSLLGTYTTKYDSGATSRVKNIHLLLRQLNNTFVRPGSVFSFNKTIGPRTAEKGYQEAPAIVGGKLVPSLGGGVCQVGTTLFNAVFFGGLDVVERHNHSFYISHYPDGRDATVSWDGPDFRFRNDTPAWVMIKAWWGDDWVTISLYGPKVDNRVSYRTSEFTDFVDPPMERIEDPTMAAGETRIEDEGIRGRNIVVRRTVTRDGRVIHTDVFESHYDPKAGMVRVGVKPKPKPKPSKETSPAPAP